MQPFTPDNTAVSRQNEAPQPAAPVAASAQLSNVNVSCRLVSDVHRDSSMLLIDKSSTSPKKRRSPRGGTKPKTRLRCPFPGCNRSFSSGIWRLKVHYRASTVARGSGVERGHGSHLTACPRCGIDIPFDVTEDELCRCFYRGVETPMPVLLRYLVPTSSTKANSAPLLVRELTTTPKCIF